jgi:alpha-beta hydrolase superfamily lysophospholipase
LVEKSSEKRGTSEETVHFASGDITLAGTLVFPEGSQPHPAVVLLHGSGPQKRDLVTARWFAAEGIAALAYDKRGVGQSGGDFLRLSDVTGLYLWFLFVVRPAKRFVAREAAWHQRAAPALRM